MSPASSASGMKVERQHQAAHRVVPAHQRLHVRDVARHDVEDRLVVAARTRVRGWRARSADSRPRRSSRRCASDAREGAVAVPAQFLRVVHRGVGVLEERLRRRSRPRGRRRSPGSRSPAPRGPRWGRGAAPRRGSSAPRGPGRPRPRGPPARSTNSSPEMRTSRSLWRSVPRMRRARLLQQLVADPVAQRVVHVLEVVEVEEDHAPRRARSAARARARPTRRSVSTSRLGRPVRPSCVAMYCRRSSAWMRGGDVLRERQDRDEAAVGVAQGGVVPLDPDDGAVLAVVAVQDAWPANRGPPIRRRNIDVDGGRVVLEDEAPVPERAAQHLVRAPAEERSRRCPTSARPAATGPTRSPRAACSRSAPRGCEWARRSSSSTAFCSWMSLVVA